MARRATTKPDDPECYDLSVAQFDEIREVFDLFDTDGSRSIDPSELRIVMRALGFALLPSDVDEIASWFPRTGDQDPALSFEEFLYVMAVKLSQRDVSADLHTSFALFDVDKRGKIGVRELKRVAKELGEVLTDEDVAMMIDENDADGDGELGEADWAKLFLSPK
ncbi:hypothetical protein HDU98_006388 [Podochytrium sp. JEL0797]|nr:hypothetical protein HDU98_006388 [Podochytrium sp. JEL0797]